MAYIYPASTIQLGHYWSVNPGNMQAHEVLQSDDGGATTVDFTISSGNSNFTIVRMGGRCSGETIIKVYNTNIISLLNPFRVEWRDDNDAVVHSKDWTALSNFAWQTLTEVVPVEWRRIAFNIPYSSGSAGIDVSFQVSFIRSEGVQSWAEHRLPLLGVGGG